MIKEGKAPFKRLYLPLFIFFSWFTPAIPLLSGQLPTILAPRLCLLL